MIVPQGAVAAVLTLEAVAVAAVVLGAVVVAAPLEVPMRPVILPLAILLARPMVARRAVEGRAMALGPAPAPDLARLLPGPMTPR